MNINKKIPQTLLPYFKRELENAKISFAQKDYHKSWNHLERAHILGQPYAVQHTQSHFKMLQFAFSLKNVKEILGQLPRLMFGGIKSFVGKIPVGNTGGANVHPLQPMQIQHDLAFIIANHQN